MQFINFKLCFCLSENDKGQYISPFHDIPMHADSNKVMYLSVVRAAWVTVLSSLNKPAEVKLDIKEIL